MFYAYYDKITGAISRCYEGPDPELQKLDTEDYFSSEEWIDPDKYLINLFTDPPELALKIEQDIDPLPAIRRDRNNLLSKTDWTQMADSPLSEERKREALLYRQALRDMTSLTNPTFPEPPAWLFS